MPETMLRANNAKSKIRARVEHVFAEQKGFAISPNVSNETGPGFPARSTSIMAAISRLSPPPNEKDTPVI
jgi:hypothetical protein